MKIRLNPNPEEVASIRKAISDNDGFCPCSNVKNADTQCMCKDFLTQKDCGPCHCGLFIKTMD